METTDELEELLSRPTPGVIDALASLRGDLVILGAGGKMGPSLAKMAKRALVASGSRHGVIAVSRFSDPAQRAALEAAGVSTSSVDLLDVGAGARLPTAGAVVFMAATKFGTQGAESHTWAVNAHLPGMVAQHYRGVPIVAFSSGNVYPFVPVAQGGATEATPPRPVGSYAWSVLARERIFEHFSREHGTPVVLIRLNYAVGLRYGVPVDVAVKVRDGVPIDLAMGYANIIWQGDANAMALRSFEVAASPPRPLNVTGPETVSIREMAMRFGDRLGREAVFSGAEEETALLNDASAAFHCFGPPLVSLDRLIGWVAHWVGNGRPLSDRPTHYETRDGVF
ncbi:MAG: epimerase [Planctomycetes bacterium]|nr:epimerase [Planctomycetota bacterium]